MQILVRGTTAGRRAQRPAIHRAAAARARQARTVRAARAARADVSVSVTRSGYGERSIRATSPLLCLRCELELREPAAADDAPADADAASPLAPLLTLKPPKNTQAADGGGWNDEAIARENE